VIEGIGERALEEFFGRGVELLWAGEKVVEAFEGVEEALDFVRPGERSGIVPAGLAFGHGEGPVEEVADVGEDLDGSAAIVAGVEIGVGLRGVANNFAGAIGDSGQGVAKKIAGRDGGWRHGG